MLKVLFVTSEVAPFSKTGGLADVSAALPAALADSGCDVRIVTPYYGFMDLDQYDYPSAAVASTRTIDLHGRAQPYGFKRVMLNNRQEIFFIECDPLYDRPGVYVDPFTNQDYIDNDYRFILLARAALELCRISDWIPDIIHCNDWQTGLVPFYVFHARQAGEWKALRTLLTIHNIAYHGLFGAETLHRIGSDAAKYFAPGGSLEFYGHVNFLKAGLEFSDALNTVSPRYAREIQIGYEYGYGLNSVLRARGGSLTGILNGIDVELWNPATDEYIKERFDKFSLEKKQSNKQALCAHFGFTDRDDVPLIGMITRIVGQKGFEILIPILTDIVNMPARIVLLGTGDPHYEYVFGEFARRIPQSVAVHLGYNERLSHMIEAGSDAFLMPSRYEPCGLNQMMSMRYGTLPIVRETGGLADTVIDADARPDHGTGFMFMDYNSDALLHAIQRMVSTFSDKERWKMIQIRAMEQDFSWNRSARLYRELYHKCLQEPSRVMP